VFCVFNVLVSRAIGDHQMPEDYKHNASIDATILMLLRLRNASQPAHSCSHKFHNETHEFSDHMYEGWERSKNLISISGLDWRSRKDGRLILLNIFIDLIDVELMV
jgi:hypothetical protein